MENKVKSVFRRREVEKIYEVCAKCDGGYWGDRVYVPVIAWNHNVITDKVIGTYDIEIPLLEPGECFYLDDIEEEVIIDKRMRSSDGSIVYYAKDKAVKTDNTDSSYHDCLARIEKMNHDEEEFKKTKWELEIYKTKLKILRDEYEKYKEDYKYKNRFFNL